jgi:hypothetical protein
MEGLKAALETTKQVIALSTGVVALTVTFLEKIVQPVPGVAREVPGTLQVGWILFGLAIVFGVWTLLAITGSMNAVDRKAREMPLNEAQQQAVASLAEGANIRVPALAMLLMFVTAISLTIASGFSL